MFKNQKDFISKLILLSLTAIITLWVIMNFTSIEGFIGKFFSVLTPFYIGFGLSYILNKPVMKIEERLKIPRIYIILGIYIIILTLLTVFIVMLMPSIISSSIQLGEDISGGIGTLSGYLTTVDFGPLESTIKDIAIRLSELLTGFTNFILVNLSNFLIKTTSTLMNLIFGIIISIYMLLDKEKINGLFHRLVNLFTTDEQSEKLNEAFSDINDVFSHFITGLIMEALAVGILAFIGFTVMGVRYAQILALIITFTNVIPYIGPFIGAVPAVVATSLYNPLLALGVGIFILILQQVDGNFIGPKIMGNYIGLDPIWIILSITIGGGLFGVLGILLSIPTGALIKLFGTKIVEKYEREKNTMQKES